MFQKSTLENQNRQGSKRRETFGADVVYVGLGQLGKSELQNSLDKEGMRTVGALQKRPSRKHQHL